MEKEGKKPSLKVAYPGKDSEDSVRVDGIGEDGKKHGMYPNIDKNNENALSVNEEIDGMGSTICLEGK